MNNIIIKISSVLDDGHMDGEQMMGGWLGWGGMWFWWIALWLLLVIIAYLVYKDATERGMNGLLWFVLIIVPWIGFLSLIAYLIIRTEKTENKYDKRSSDQILDDRYALGEITRNEYLRKKEDLKQITN
jgi:putative membrane protein